jgi:ubiquinol-cytochrome c reductase cytochrome b subunit
MRALVGRALDFLESRAGLRSSARAFLDAPVPGGASFGRATGGALALLIALQLLTGLVLALYYSPSVTTAWASVVFLEERISAGRLVRGLHAFGASAIVLAFLARYLVVIGRGEYKKPREVTWAVFLLIGVVLAAISVSGTVLPFDQNAYWATRVRMGYARMTPGVGSTLHAVAQGGEDVGNLTLAHFYTLHAVVLPAILVALGAWLWKLRRREALTVEPADGPVARFWPGQALRTLVLFAGALAVLVAVVHHTGGAPLDGPADPAGEYEARPEWYFLPLFQLVKLLPSGLAFVGTEVVPVALVLALVALPFLDRGPSRGRALAIGLAPVLGALGLGLLAAVNDSGNVSLHESQAQAAKDAADARALFRKNDGVPPEGPLALYELDPIRVGRIAFKEHCASCHSLTGRPGMKGPDLGHYLSPAWLATVIRTPNAPTLWGKADKMGAIDLTPQEVALLVDYTRSLESPEAAKAFDAKRLAEGAKLFRTRDCTDCHETSGKKAGSAPNLGGYGSDEWLLEFLKKPTAPRFYLEKNNKMPAFADKMTEAELKAVVVYLRTLSRGED